MTTRERFAMAALTGCIACGKYSDNDVINQMEWFTDMAIAKLAEGQTREPLPGEIERFETLYRRALSDVVDGSNEIARIRAELAGYRGAEFEMSCLRNDVEMLRAELAKYTGDLTDEQGIAAWNLWCVSGSSGTGVEGIRVRDEIIRKVRSGEGANNG